MREKQANKTKSLIIHRIESNRIESAMNFLSEKDLLLILLSTTLTSFVLREIYFLTTKKKQNKRETNVERNFYLQCRNVSDFERMSEQILPSHRFYYINYKAGRGITNELTRKYFDEHLLIIPRVLIDLDEISLKIRLFGREYSHPIIIAPTTFHCLTHPDGELATARAAAKTDTIYSYNWIYSTKAENEILEVQGPKWLHIYLTIDDQLLKELVEKAERKGYEGIVITCDHPTDRVRDDVLPLFDEASKTSDQQLKSSMPMPNLNAKDIVERQNISNPKSFHWNRIEFIRSLTRLPIICKGILSLEDVQLAIDHHVQAIIISNHGGRQVDTVPPAIQLLADIVDLVQGRLEVLIDSGIRSGTDILKCLALGARAVLIGRPVLYGLTCGGEAGVEQVINILKKELIYDMSSVGCSSIEQINRKILYQRTNKDEDHRRH